MSHTDDALSVRPRPKKGASAWQGLKNNAFTQPTCVTETVTHNDTEL